MNKLLSKIKNVVLKDNFNIATTDYLEGDWKHGGDNYIAIRNKGAAFKAVKDNNSTAMVFIDVGIKDYYVEVEFSVVDYTQYLYIKGDDDSNFITLSYSNDEIEIREYIDWNDTSTYYKGKIENGDVVGALCLGRKITVFINDIAICEYTIKNLRFVDSTNTGMMIQGSNSAMFDNFIVFEIDKENAEEQEKLPNNDEFYAGYFSDDEIDEFMGNNVYYMSYNGDDENSGLTRSEPLATLEGFKNKIEKISNISEATLYVEDGDYILSKPIDLYGKRFGNTVKVNIIGIGNKAEFTTSDKLDNSKFVPISMNGTKVYRYDLSSLNINFKPKMVEYPNSSYNVNGNIWEAPFLICEGERMYLASYPKADKWTLANEDKAIGLSNGFYITAKTGEDSQRLNKITNWKNVFLDGFIGTPYANHQISVLSYNKKNKRIIASKKTVDWDWQTYTGGIRYRLINIKDEVKEPGEYYIDYDNKVLYFIPPENIDIQNCKIQLAYRKYEDDKGMFYCSNDNTDSNDYYEGSYINFNKINFSGFRNDIFSEIISNMTFEKCIFKNTCYSAIKSLSPKNLNIFNCKFSNISKNAIKLNNSDYSVPAVKSRLNLIGCNCNIVGNRFINMGYLHPWCGYASPVDISTVGTRVKGNSFNHNAGISILFAQNDNIIEANIIKDGCFLLGDSGSIYGGRDWAARGNVIMNNHLYGNNAYFNDDNWVVGIYLDDAISGNIVENNNIKGYKVGILLGGGRDNTLKNNLLEECIIPIVADARGVQWMDLDEIYDSLEKVYPDYTGDLWKNKYHGIETLPQTDPNIKESRNKNLKDINCPGYPKNNKIINNIYKSCVNEEEIDNLVDKYGAVINNVKA